MRYGGDIKMLNIPKIDLICSKFGHLQEKITILHKLNTALGVQCVSRSNQHSLTRSAECEVCWGRATHSTPKQLRLHSGELHVYVGITEDEGSTKYRIIINM